MFNKFGFSIYISTFDEQKDMLEKFSGSGYYVFTSFHMQEEFNQMNDYSIKAKELCKWLKVKGFKIIGDVSAKTLEFFKYESIIEFAKDFELDILRLDYGFNEKEILSISKEFPISFNPSTEDDVLAKKILDSGVDVFALHNFYPRPETGLDSWVLKEINERLKAIGIKTLAFIAGDELKRGPIYEGLPTIEYHRRIPPYAAFLDLLKNYNVDGIFVGDVRISEVQSNFIVDFLDSGIISLPVRLSSNYEYLYNQVFTIRADSPYTMMRLQESREYSCDGEKTNPFNCISRGIGAVTMDNIEYKRYSGEIQILRKPLKQDDRVNVIGMVDEDYLSVMDCIKNKEKIKFVKL